MIFLMGEVTKEVHSGDLVSECQFIGYIPVDQYTPHDLLFHDITFNCFRRCGWEKGKDILVNKKCSIYISDLL